MGRRDGCGRDDRRPIVNQPIGRSETYFTDLHKRKEIKENSF
jgi:hypothetical protein